MCECEIVCVYNVCMCGKYVTMGVHIGVGNMGVYECLYMCNMYVYRRYVNVCSYVQEMCMYVCTFLRTPP